ncbi:MAG: hypothetical protein WCC60_16135, partial [Ilumatobacteraceae bacterium]
MIPRPRLVVGERSGRGQMAADQDGPLEVTDPVAGFHLDLGQRAEVTHVQAQSRQPSVEPGGVAAG